ncbi:MAG: O-antigen ligase family protein [Acidobacteria bacterium]|nr:O-antigen ligase family protein [Acidobacteriota bacterium]
MTKAIEPLYLLGLTLILGYTAWHRGGFAPEATWALLALGLLSLPFWLLGRNARVSGKIFWPLVLLPLYVGLQLVPLPMPLLKVLAPVRWEHLDALEAVLPPVEYAALSLVPAETFALLLTLLAAALILLTMRKIRPEWAALPLLVIATLEALLGILQYWHGDSAAATGTWRNHSHYANFLAMALPFALMYAVALARSEKHLRVSTLAGVALIGSSALIALAIIFSLSGSGFIAALAGVSFMGVLQIDRKHRAWQAGGALLVLLLTVTAFLVLPSDPVVVRFAGEAKFGEGSRPAIWAETWKVLPDHLVAGSGLGTLQSALYRQSDIMHDRLIDYAHNDWLQLLVELGVVGFGLLLALLLALILPALKTALRYPKSVHGAIAIGAIGSLAAVAIHGFYNFNVYAPANLFGMAMAAGIAARSGPRSTD